MAVNGYYLVRNEYNNNDAIIDNRKLRGFQVTPKNQVKYDGVQVNHMTVIKPAFIEKVLKRKIKRRLDLYLQYIIRLLDDTENNSGGNDGIRIALNDLDRYKSIIRNKYRMYLDEKYVDLLLKKIALLERELKINKSLISKCLNKHRKTAKGFIWRYVDER